VSVIGDMKMKVSEMIRCIKKEGCKIDRNGSSHDIWMNPKTGGKTSIPRHPSKELAIGTADNILKELNLK
jgi:predicted RNA binding protein YcfA (HicA-like mRNA interferase family)